MDFTKLTPRHDPDRPDSWLIYCGDIGAGIIARSTVRPNAQEEWVWRASFYPGSCPSEIKTGTAAEVTPAGSSRPAGSPSS